MSQLKRNRTKRRELVDLIEESDDEITVICEKQAPGSNINWDYEGSQTFTPYYTRTTIPTYTGRREKRELKKKNSWANPLPSSCDLFTDTAPETVSDLALHPAKIKELRNWIRNKCCNRTSKDGQILLLTGPSGCGKTVAVRAICKDLGVDVVEWEGDSEYEIVRFGTDTIVKEVNEMTSFLDFVRSVKYSLSGTARRLVLIKYVPNQAYNDLRSFHNSVGPLLKSSRQAFIFCMSSLESCWDLSPRRLFPSSFLLEYTIDQITFNPVANTFMRKGLRHVTDNLGLTSRLDRRDFQAIERIANGDLRSAINMLQFSLLSSEKTFTLSPAIEATLNDDMFHMLGRLLYAKREDDFESFDTDINLSTELRRPKLERDVNDIIEMTKAPTEVVLCFLHEHEPRFSPSLVATRRFLDTLSFCDSMCDSWSARFSYLDEYAVQICARATMFYNYKSQLNFRGLYKFTKPKAKLLRVEVQQLAREIYEVMNTGGSYNGHYCSLTIPYYIILSSHLNNSQFSVVSYINRPFNFSWQIGRASWEQKIRHQVTYRSSQAQLMRAQLQKSLQSLNAHPNDDENEFILIEDSSDDVSHDSFDDPVEFY